MSSVEEVTPSTGRLVRIGDARGTKWWAKVSVLGSSDLFVTSESRLVPGARLTLELDGTRVDAEVVLPAVQPTGAYVRLDNVVLLDAPVEDEEPTEDVGRIEHDTGPHPTGGIEPVQEVTESTVTIMLGGDYASTLPGTPGQDTIGTPPRAAGLEDEEPSAVDAETGLYPILDVENGRIRFGSKDAFVWHYDEYLKSGSLIASGRRLRRGRVYQLTLEVPGENTVEVQLRVVAAMAGRVGFLMTHPEAALSDIASILKL